MSDPQAGPEQPRPQGGSAPGHATFVIRSLNFGGAERQLIELTRGLVARGWRVEVITFYAGGDLKPELDRAGVPVRDLAKRSRWDLVALLRLVRLVRDARAPILHAYLGEANFAVAALRPFLGRRMVVWGIRSADLSRNRQDWLSGVLGRVNRLLSRRVDLIVCNSRAGLRAHAAEGYPADRMVVVPNGVDTTRFAPDADARGRVRDAWGIASDELLVGLVGRLDPIKGHELLLRAVAPLAATHRVRVVFVGAGPEDYRAQVDAVASGAGIADRVVWAGARSDMGEVYAALDLLVSASFGEGFSNVIAEAMASGVPCVVTDVGDSAEIVGDAGWTCPPDDVAGLRSALEEALGAPEDRARRAGLSRARIVELFDTQQLIDRTATHLTEALAARRRR